MRMFLVDGCGFWVLRERGRFGSVGWLVREGRGVLGGVLVVVVELELVELVELVVVISDVQY